MQVGFKGDGREEKKKKEGEQGCEDFKGEGKKKKKDRSSDALLMSSCCNTRIQNLVSLAARNRVL